MSRLFEDRTIRRVKSLDGAWRMRLDGDNVGLSEGWFANELGGNTVSVPSVWNIDKELFAYEGACWYEKTFFFEGGSLFLSFGAVMTEAEVWLDGKHLGSHYGGFCEFNFVEEDVSRGYHRLTVRVDNSFDADAIPQPVVDWYHYGGIIRSVSAEQLCGIAVISNKFDYTLSSDLKSADCSFEVCLYNACSTSTRDTLTLTLGDRTVYTGEVELLPHEYKTVTVSGITEDGVRLWDEGKPELYTITARTSTDDLIDRVGFRKIEVCGTKILLNGREIEIRGVNRHEEHPEFGFAFPQSLMHRDIKLITDMGCNFIRGSHYPNSREFVDLLDEHGILFWSEIPIWGCGFKVEALASERVVERGLEMHREMVKYYYNHPSIVMWGMHNEILSDTEAGLEMTKKYYPFLKENGGNRLVVFASHKPMTDICLEYTDVICVNQYRGWYSGEISDWKAALDEFAERRRELGVYNKPVIMSEFGAAALYGWHDDENTKWTEEYQAKLIAHCLDLFHEYPTIVGSLIWQFSDIRTSKQAGITRARGFNNKGLVNEHRKPKLAYFAAQNCYKRYIAEENK